MAVDPTTDPSQNAASSSAGPRLTPTARTGQTPQQDQNALPHDSLISPFPINQEMAVMMTASTFVNINAPSAIQTWMNSPINTVADVLARTQAYHHKVIRPEIYHLVTQVDHFLRALDDKLQVHDGHMLHLMSDHRREAKQRCALMVVLSGFPTDMGPAERTYVIC